MPLKPNVVFGAKRTVSCLDFPRFIVLQKMYEQYGNYASRLIRGDLSVKYDPDVPAIVVNAILLQKVWTGLHSDLQANCSGCESIIFSEQYYCSLIENLTIKNRDFNATRAFWTCTKVSRKQRFAPLRSIVGGLCSPGNGVTATEKPLRAPIWRMEVRDQEQQQQVKLIC